MLLCEEKIIEKMQKILKRNVKITYSLFAIEDGKGNKCSCRHV